MKKQYIQPSIKAYKIHSSSILTGSDIDYGGSNTGTGNYKAESKSNNLWGWGDDEE